VKPFSGTIVTDDTENEISIYKVSDPNVTISGNLTIKDVTKNIEFPAKVSVSESGATAMAKFMIDRTEWGITYKGMPDDLIRNDVWFGVSLATN
jgi:polyisoprenoid-binding protein YceI